ncbi:MAG TPA: methyltransferase domain-containing protein [Saprospiraceae bacterium]|nr:methyltransferase domain-containing protein [Saprospiraceae bacterium]
MSNISILSNPDQYEVKEQLYIKLRTLEKRIITIDEIRKLPHSAHQGAISLEWKWRKKSKDALIAYLSKNKASKIILELGCGNGWLANHLSKLDHSEVYAIDLNMYELLQGQEAFSQENLHFIYGNIFEDILPKVKFDYIVLAASIQYFPSLTQLIERLRKLLNELGEIHIIDSNFYTNVQLEAARISSNTYYTSLRMEEMNQYYFHHTLSELEQFKPVQMNKLIQNPFEQFLAKYLNFNNYNIFPWFKLKR